MLSLAAIMYKYVNKASQKFSILSLISIPKFYLSSPAKPTFTSHTETITEIDSQYGRRLDKYLQKKYNLKWDQIQSLFRKKKIKVLSHQEQTLNRDPAYLLSPGDVIYLPKHFFDSEKDVVDPNAYRESAEVKYDKRHSALFSSMLMYEDDKFMAINKFSGISSQGGAEVKLNLYFLFNNYLNWKKLELQESYEYTPGIVHRLDKDTTGVMVLAKDKPFAAQFAHLLKSRNDISKTYIGVVDGIPTPILELLRPKGRRKMHTSDNKTGLLSNLMAGAGFDKRYIASSEGEESARESKTNYEILAIVKMERESISPKVSYLLNPKIYPEKTLSESEAEAFFDELKEEETFITILRYEIEGGRKHQIRIHSALGLEAPLLLDKKFNKGSNCKSLVKQLLDDSNDKTLRGEDFVCIEGKEMISTGVKDKAVIEKHISSTIEKEEILFLHSLQLKFLIEGRKHEFRAGLPLHMLAYFNYIFGQEFKNIVEKF